MGVLNDGRRLFEASLLEDILDSIEAHPHDGADLEQKLNYDSFCPSQMH